MTLLKPIHKHYTDGVWELPTYKTKESAGLDFIAAIDAPVIIPKDYKKSVIIPLGLSIWINNPAIMLVLVPKSGLGCKKGMVLGNNIGIVDSDYQGELKACIYNNGENSLNIYPGDFVCQGIFMPVIHPIFTVVDSFDSKTDRHTDGGINRN